MTKSLNKTLKHLLILQDATTDYYNIHNPKTYNKNDFNKYLHHELRNFELNEFRLELYDPLNDLLVFQKEVNDEEVTQYITQLNNLGFELTEHKQVKELNKDEEYTYESNLLGLNYTLFTYQDLPRTTILIELELGALTNLLNLNLEPFFLKNQ